MNLMEILEITSGIFAAAGLVMFGFCAAFLNTRKKNNEEVKDDV